MKHLDELLIAAWQVARDHFGEDRVTPERVARAVRATSEVYNHQRTRLDSLQGDPAALLARLCFFLPRDCPKLWPILDELYVRRALPTKDRWRVLDLGSGLGTTSLGLSLFVAEHEHALRIDVTAVEADRTAVGRHRDLLKELRDVLPENTLRCSETRLPKLSPGLLGERWDVILLGLSLNELHLDTADAVMLIRRLVGTLSEGGLLLILEPALKQTTRDLQTLRDALIETDTANILAPCLHRDPCPMLANPRDWCHSDVDSPLPDLLAEVAKIAGLRDRRLTHSYLAMTRAGPAAPPQPDEWRLVSRLLGSKGKVEGWVCGGGGYKRLMRLDRHYSDYNAGLDTLQRGACFSCPAIAKGDRLRISQGDRIIPGPQRPDEAVSLGDHLGSSE